MKIRSLTVFFAPRYPPRASQLAPLGSFAAAAKAAFEAAGYEVQTLRLATTPFPRWVKPLTQSRAVEAAVALEALATEAGFGYVSLGPALPEILESYSFVPDMLAATENAFLSGVIAEKKAGIHMQALTACADIIQKAALLEADGFANLRFAALANVPAGSPFLPAAYHAGGPSAFAIGTQAADLAVAAFEGAGSVAQGSRILTESIQQHAQALSKVSRRVAKPSKLSFGGIDFSLAPFPEDSESLGTAFERMGVSAVGMHGSLAAAAILTQAIDAAKFPRAGFNGLLLPVLEDATLARRAAQGVLTISDLLMYSALCGAGLDTLPLAGSTRPEELSALLLDLAALALRLDKPLTARLMPIPGKAAGDQTSFDFPFFANSRLMELKSEPLKNALASSQTVFLDRKRSKK
ncbi:MAG TPA: DUF711 family protein [Anaerolineales bacterium]|nr:DUF711 family protein [Anaerolineales bacterium]